MSYENFITKLFNVNPSDLLRPRQFTVGIKKADSTNFVLLIKLFELDMPSNTFY